MKLSEELRLKVRDDLGLDLPFARGKDFRVRNCWHFTTDGNAIDSIFTDEEDFIDGMNRVFVVSRCFNVVILAFVLMDNHVHFILHGPLEECLRFMQEFVRRTSMAIKQKHGISHKLEKVPIHHQMIDTDRYLKIAVCYVMKNPPEANLPYTAWDYPWGSGSLYFRSKGTWTSPIQDPLLYLSSSLTREKRKAIFRTNVPVPDGLCMSGKMVLPSEYVAFEVVEELFKTQRAFNFFFCISKDSDVESKDGAVSRLSLPDHELRKLRDGLCQEMFGKGSTNTLSTQERIRLARALKKRYNSSTKQIARMTGLVYKEIVGLI